MARLTSLDGGALSAFIKRIEHLAEEKAAIGDDIKNVYGEVKSAGYDPKILRKIVALRRVDKQKREEEAEVLALYLSALGDFFDTPLGGSASADDD
jgi:uncharacterized protein (UPF0335 family)